MSEGSPARTYKMGPMIRQAYIDEFEEYYYQGTPILELGAPWIVIVDTLKQTILCTTREESSRDSIYHEIIPGDRINFTITPAVIWDSVSQCFMYSYEIKSDSSSLTSFSMFKVEQKSNALAIFRPRDWFPPEAFEGMYFWDTFPEKGCKPSESISGFGLKSNCPPSLGRFEMWGNEIELRSSGWDEGSGDIPGGINSEHSTIEGRTIVPGRCPEAIIPEAWLNDIIAELHRFEINGFISHKATLKLQKLLCKLRGKIKDPKGIISKNLEKNINHTIHDLSSRKGRVEAEVIVYIIENLRYMLRNQHIIEFKSVAAVAEMNLPRNTGELSAKIEDKRRCEVLVKLKGCVPKGILDYYDTPLCGGKIYLTFGTEDAKGKISWTIPGRIAGRLCKSGSDTSFSYYYQIGPTTEGGTKTCHAQILMCQWDDESIKNSVVLATCNFAYTLEAALKYPIIKICDEKYNPLPSEAALRPEDWLHIKMWTNCFPISRDYHIGLIESWSPGDTIDVHYILDDEFHARSAIPSIEAPGRGSIIDFTNTRKLYVVVSYFGQVVSKDSVVIESKEVK